MKYMGSKRFLLKNGLGELITSRAQYARRIVDLFCGAGSVAWFAAEKTMLPVLAVDLQTYAVILAQAVIGRDTPLDPENLEGMWLDKVKRTRVAAPLWQAAVSLEESATNIQELVREARALCGNRSTVGPVWNAYGGHYFSPTQALTFDHLLKHLPMNQPERAVCLAATVSAASRCAAAPGHTAQPFQPTETARKFLSEAWKRDPLAIAKLILSDICPRHAKVIGTSLVADAFDVVASLRADDLVIVDPPYSGVHYSRFYHVLETIARGNCGSVTGIGRYPPASDRPQSSFSVASQSRHALEKLLSSLAVTGATVIFTFPAGECSNGLSGRIVSSMARNWYEVEEKLVNGQFSTLGGNNSHRAARTVSSELVLLMQPRDRIITG